MLYIYQADRMSMIDLSEVSIDPQFGNTLSKMSLLQELYLGSENHKEWKMSPGNTGFLTNLDLGRHAVSHYIGYSKHGNYNRQLLKVSTNGECACR